MGSAGLAPRDVLDQLVELARGCDGLVGLVRELPVTVHELDVEVRALVAADDLARSISADSRFQGIGGPLTSVPMHASPTAQPTSLMARASGEWSMRMARAKVGT